MGELPNKALQATPFYVAKIRAIFVRVVLGKFVQPSWGAPELERWAVAIVAPCLTTII